MSTITVARGGCEVGYEDTASNTILQSTAGSQSAQRTHNYTRKYEALISSPIMQLCLFSTRGDFCHRVVSFRFLSKEVMWLCRYDSFPSKLPPRLREIRSVAFNGTTTYRYSFRIAPFISFSECRSECLDQRSLRPRVIQSKQ
jgi:hypothetical protein